MEVQVANDGKELRIVAPFFDLSNIVVSELECFIKDPNKGLSSRYPDGLPCPGFLLSAPDESASAPSSD